MGYKHVPDAVLVQFRAPRGDVEQLAARAGGAGVTLSAYLRAMVEWDLDEENEFSVERLLALEQAEVERV